MTTHGPEQALTRILAAIVRDHELADLFADVVRDCASLLPADAAAILVDNGRHGLELLSATSHRTAELEVYQAQRSNGPCVDVLATGEAISATGTAEIVDRWPDVGQLVVASGFRAVHAFPMTWHGQTVGGLNVFSERPEPLSEASQALAQHFADAATLALLQPRGLDDDELAERVAAALEGRAVIEQAKGVLAQRLGLDMAAAYDNLVDRALHDAASLSATARQVIGEAQGR